MGFISNDDNNTQSIKLIFEQSYRDGVTVTLTEIQSTEITVWSKV